MVFRKEVFLILLVLLISFVNADSLGVSPAKFELNFEPNLKQTFDFGFYGSNAGYLKLSAEGDLAEYAKLDKDHLDGGGGVRVTIKLPKEIEKPGEHYIYIAAEQAEENAEGGIQFLGKIRASIKIIVPYPGEYAEISFKTSDIKKGEDVPYDLVINNLGTNKIMPNSNIEIYDNSNKMGDILYLGECTIEPTKSREYSGKIKTSTYKAGSYKAVAIVSYAGKSAKAESYFKIGDLFVDIINYSNDFQRNKINKFEIGVESFWNDPIENLYADISIVDYPINFATPSITIGGFQKGNLAGFFDSTTIQENKFKAKITLNYEGKTTEKIVDLRFKNEYSYILIIIISGIALFLIIILILFIWIIKLQSMLGRALNEREHGKKKKK